MIVSVEISEEVYLVCTLHAHTTEAEEIMGFLLGEVVPLPPLRGETVSEGDLVRVYGVSLQVRSDRRKDRVEIAPEQQYAASEEAEALGKALGRPVVVVGWYHSHPHITVLPSHVDVRTQFQNQQLSAAWLGLIVSCYATGGVDMQAGVGAPPAAAQSGRAGLPQLPSANSYASAAGSASSSSSSSASSASASSSSASASASASASSSGSMTRSSRSQTTCFQALDSRDSESMRRFAKRLHADDAGQPYRRLEVPHIILPSAELVEDADATEHCVRAIYAALEKLLLIFASEERVAFLDATVGRAAADGNLGPTALLAALGSPLALDTSGVHPMSATFNSSVYAKVLARLVEIGSTVIASSIADACAKHSYDVELLTTENDALEEEVARLEALAASEGREVYM